MSLVPGLSPNIRQAPPSGPEPEETEVAPGITLTIDDDGIGVPPDTRRSGTANLDARARARGGTFSLERLDPGTRLTWSVPLPRGER